jgi:hypothetical protein
LRLSEVTNTSQSKPWNLVTIVLWKAGPTAPYVYNFFTKASVKCSFQSFDKHIKEFYSSADFKARAQDAVPFFKGVKDYVFGRPASLENAVCVISIFFPDVFGILTFILVECKQKQGGINSLIELIL